MKLGKTRLARTLLIQVYFWVVGRCIYSWIRCFDVTRLSSPDTDVFVLLEEICCEHGLQCCYAVYEPVWQSLYVVSHGHFHIRCYDVTLLQIAYLQPLVDLYKSFHTVIFVSAVTMLRCYTLPTCNLLSICISR